MDVRLIAYTEFNWDAIDDLMGWGEGHTPDPKDADLLAEFAGRTCYLSYDRPNTKTFTNQEYLANILDQQHYSVLEHASASFYVAGVSRNLLIELERHRFLSFSVVSTRYVDARKLDFVIPPALRDRYQAALNEGDSFDRDLLFEDYNHVVTLLLNDGKTRKQAREAAAFFLPGGIETRFVVTGNLRAWRDVISKRRTPSANAEIRGFVELVLERLKDKAPNSLADFWGSL